MTWSKKNKHHTNLNAHMLQVLILLNQRLNDIICTQNQKHNHEQIYAKLKMVQKLSLNNNGSSKLFHKHRKKLSQL